MPGAVVPDDARVYHVVSRSAESIDPCYNEDLIVTAGNTCIVNDHESDDSCCKEHNNSCSKQSDEGDVSTKSEPDDALKSLKGFAASCRISNDIVPLGSALKVLERFSFSCRAGDVLDVGCMPKGDRKELHNKVKTQYMNIASTSDGTKEPKHVSLTCIPCTRIIRSTPVNVQEDPKVVKQDIPSLKVTHVAECIYMRRGSRPFIGVAGHYVEAVAAYWNVAGKVPLAFQTTRRQTREPHHHITIINHKDVAVLEAKGHSPDDVCKQISALDNSARSWTPRGIGVAGDSNNRTVFVVVNWESVNAFRTNLGLEKHHFHITLGFTKNDIFDVDKSTVLPIHELTALWE